MHQHEVAVAPLEAQRALEEGSGAQVERLQCVGEVEHVALGDADISIASAAIPSGRPIGIIMLTARRDVIDRVVGLERGTDD